MKYLVLLLILIGFTGTAFAQYMENISDPNLEYTDPIIRLTDENIIPPPLKQFKAGIQIDEITCKKGLELVIKSDHRHHPMCVKPETKTKLIERGLASMYNLDHDTSEMPTNAKLMANATNTIFINVVEMDGVYRWYNDQEVNPTLTLWANVENTIQIHNPTDEKHEFVIESQSTEIATSGDILSDGNGNVTIKPNMEYTLEYHCKYHPDTMKGQIEIISP